jgi:ribose 1,5-bisphosphokinase
MLILVVGPSGAGKDTLLDASHVALRADTRFRFVRRVITRPVDAGGEAHEAVTPAEFAARRFALRWHAHGIDYGIPDDIDADLRDGRIVVASVSRSVVAEAASRYEVRVIAVSASVDVLAARLLARGREDAADIARRLARDVPLPGGVGTETVVNDWRKARRGFCPHSTAQRNPLGDDEIGVGSGLGEYADVAYLTRRGHGGREEGFGKRLDARLFAVVKATGQRHVEEPRVEDIGIAPALQHRILLR